MKTRTFLSVLCGILFAAVVFVIVLILNPNLALPLALLGGAIFTLLLQITLTLIEKRASKQYAILEKKITRPVFYKTNCNFNLGYTVKNGRIYFCQDGIVLISIDIKPCVFEEIFSDQIEKYEFDRLCMNIYTKDGRIYVLTISDMNTLLEELKKENWIV